jgi:SH2 domain
VRRSLPKTQLFWCDVRGRWMSGPRGASGAAKSAPESVSGPEWFHAQVNLWWEERKRRGTAASDSEEGIAERVMPADIVAVALLDRLREAEVANGGGESFGSLCDEAEEEEREQEAERLRFAVTRVLREMTCVARGGDPFDREGVEEDGIDDHITAAGFDRFLGCFGPLDGGALARVHYLTKPWFSGFCRPRNASNALSSEPPGTFLVRFQTARDDLFFCLAFRLSGRDGVQVQHRRIHYAGDGVVELPDGTVRCGGTYHWHSTKPSSLPDKFPTLDALLATMEQSGELASSQMAVFNDTYLPPRTTRAGCVLTV